MSSLLTNESSMVALSTLRSINKNLAQIQNEISTGKKVSSARDNAAFWAVSTVMQSDVDGFTAIQKSLSLGSGTVGVARDAAEQITELLKQIKTIVVAAQEENVDRAKMQTDIQQLRDQIETIVNAAQFNGLNLLKAAGGAAAEPTPVTLTTTGDLADVSALENEELTVNGETFTFTDDQDQTQAIVDFLNGVEGVSAEVDDDGNIVITSTVELEISFSDDAVGTTLGLEAGTFTPEAGAGGDAIDNLQAIEDLIQISIDAAAAFGSAQKRIDIQGEFVRSIIDAMKLGIGALTDADMEEASARLQSLQVQQQLGIQALAIANQAPQALLMLFR